MKIYFILLFSCILYVCSGQRIYQNPYQYLTGKYFSEDDYEKRFDQQIYYYAPLAKRLDQTIHYIYLKTKNKKGKPVLIKQEFNKAGKLVYAYNPSRKYEYTATYLDDTLLIYSFKKTKNKRRENKSAYENGKIKLYEELKNGKTHSTVKYWYTDFNKPLKTEYNRKKTTRTMTYEYTENLEAKKITLFENGKVKKVWNYDCKPEGEVQEKAKEEVLSSRCEYREENNDGSYTVYVRSIEKGKPHLTEKQYSKDATLILKNVYEEDSILRENWYKDGEWEISTYYSKRGKIKDKYRYKYNQQRIITEYEYFSGNKLAYCYKNSYDNSGNCIKKERYTNPKKLKTSSKEIYEYSPNGLMTKQQHYNKSRLGFIYEFEYVSF